MVAIRDVGGRIARTRPGDLRGVEAQGLQRAMFLAACSGLSRLLGRYECHAERRGRWLAGDEGDSYWRGRWLPGEILWLRAQILRL